MSPNDRLVVAICWAVLVVGFNVFILGMRTGNGRWSWWPITALCLVLGVLGTAANLKAWKSDD